MATNKPVELDRNQVCDTAQMSFRELATPDSTMRAGENMALTV